MNKLTLGIASVGLAASVAATAALPTGAAPFQINIPNLKSGVMFNLTGLYLRGTNNDLDYAVVTPTPALPTVAANTYSVKPKYKFGFHVGLGYVFPNSGNDIQVGWTHYNATNSNAVTVPGGALVGPPEFPFLGVGTLGANASGSAQFKYNAGDLDVGQYINVGSRLQMRLFGGFRYASIDENLNSTFLANGNAAFGNFGFNQLLVGYSSQMDGFGPRFGVDTSYHITNCFGLIANVSTAMLVSRIKTSTVATANATPVNPPLVANVGITSDRQNRIVPNVEGKLGLDYSFPFNSSVLTVAAGYQVSQYFDAIDRVVGVARKSSNFGIDGPFLSLNLKVG